MNRKNLAVSYLWHKAIADKEKARLSLELLLNNGVDVKYAESMIFEMG